MHLALLEFALVPAAVHVRRHALCPDTPVAIAECNRRVVATSEKVAGAAKQ